MSADILGTDDAGRTTWRLSPGQPSGTLSVVDFPVGKHSLRTNTLSRLTIINLFGTATLVEGPNDVHSFQDKGDFVVSDDCTIKDGVAACSALVSSSAGIETILSTETVSAKAFEVQVTGIPKNSASRMVGSASLAVPVLVMGVAYSLIL